MAVDPIELAQKLIKCPSITPHDKGALRVIEKALKPMGFNCHYLEFSDEEHPTVKNLYARRGNNGKHLCFAGHTDVVPTGDTKSWTHAPFSAKIVDEKLYGRGAVDMKGAIACFIAATSEFLDEQGFSFEHSISFLITGDEEGDAVNGTKKMLNWLKERREAIDACIVGEPTNPQNIGDMIKIGRRGSVTINITVLGVQGHVAYPDLAANPAPYLIKILDALSKHTLDEGTEYFDPSNLEIVHIHIDNSADNVIPEKATARINIRFNDQHYSEDLIGWVSRICSDTVRNNEKISFEMYSRVSGEAFLTEPGLLSDTMLMAVEETLNTTPTISTTGGTSDARFIKDICPVVEFGLINTTAHKIDEHISIDDLQKLKTVYKKAIELYFSV